MQQACLFIPQRAINTSTAESVMIHEGGVCWRYSVSKLKLSIQWRISSIYTVMLRILFFCAKQDLKTSE